MPSRCPAEDENGAWNDHGVQRCGEDGKVAARKVDSEHLQAGAGKIPLQPREKRPEDTHRFYCRRHFRVLLENQECMEVLGDLCLICNKRFLKPTHKCTGLSVKQRLARENMNHEAVAQVLKLEVERIKLQKELMELSIKDNQVNSTVLITELYKTHSEARHGFMKLAAAQMQGPAAGGVKQSDKSEVQEKEKVNCGCVCVCVYVL